MPDVSIVIVSFNTRELLRACLKSVMASNAVSLEVFVVDNNSSDKSAEMVEAEFPRVTLIRNSENRGFAAANNLALPRAAGHYVLLLNPDTVVQSDTLIRLVAFMDSQPSAGICGPKVLNSDGSLQSCGYTYPTILSEIRQSKNINKLIRLFVGEAPTFPPTDQPRQAEWVDGCCLMIRRSVIEQIGLLDEQYFLYAEELDWCFNAHKHGWAIYTVPSAQMTHHQGKSSEQKRDSSLALLIETRLSFYRKNYGALNALMISIVYVLGCLKQLNREPQKSKVKLRAVMHWLAWEFIPAPVVPRSRASIP
jgi:N-acetylglucosaminyl-diphospho-decaprenol L-rhamnosyltransferase